MTGVRLWIGILTMGVIVPAVILFFFRTYTLAAWTTVAVPCFFGWCVAEFVANVLARPKIENRKAADVLKEWK